MPITRKIDVNDTVKFHDIETAHEIYGPESNSYFTVIDVNRTFYVIQQQQGKACQATGVKFSVFKDEVELVD